MIMAKIYIQVIIILFKFVIELFVAPSTFSPAGCDKTRARQNSEAIVGHYLNLKYTNNKHTHIYVRQYQSWKI